MENGGDRAEVEALEAQGYTIVGKLGEGGFGKVFLVSGPLGEQIAAKVFSPLKGGDRNRAKARFERGAEIVRHINDERIVKVLAVTSGERPIIFMEYIQGGSLRHAAQAKDRRLVRLIALVADAARVVGAIHRGDISEKTVVHRDVKPLNILIRNNRAVLADFDLAYASDTDMTGLTVHGGSREGRVFAASRFMHPEFRAGFQQGVADPLVREKFRSKALDYYGLCASLFFVLTGSAPENRQLSIEELERRQDALKAELDVEQIQHLTGLVVAGLSDTIKTTPVDVDGLADEIERCLRPARWWKRQPFGTIVPLLLGTPLKTVAALKRMYSGRLTLAGIVALLLLTVLPILGGVAAFYYFGGTGAVIGVWTLCGLLRAVLGFVLVSEAQNDDVYVVRPTMKVAHHLRHVATVATYIAYAAGLYVAGAVKFSWNLALPGVTRNERAALVAAIVRPPVSDVAPAPVKPKSETDPQQTNSTTSTGERATDPTAAEQVERRWQTLSIDSFGPRTSKPTRASLGKNKAGEWVLTTDELACKVGFNQMTGNPAHLEGCQSLGATQLRYHSFNLWCSNSYASYIICTQSLSWVVSGATVSDENAWQKGTFTLRLHLPQPSRQSKQASSQTDWTRAVDDLVNSNARSFAACASGLEVNGTRISGEVKTRFNIDPRGTISGATLQSATVAATAANCVVLAHNGLRISAPSGMTGAISTFRF